MNQDNCTNCLNSCCIFKDCRSFEWIESITFSSNQHIFLECMPVKGLYVVRRGEVKEYDNNTQRKESENRIVRNGEIFGHKDFSADKHKFRAIALKNSKICYLKKDSLYQVCLGNPELSLNLLKFFKEELIKTDKKYKNNLYS